MPEEVVGEVEEVAFPVPEVPGWDRSVTAAGVLHGRDLPRGVDRAPLGTFVLRSALPGLIHAVNGSL
jgi:hypothetical protein